MRRLTRLIYDDMRPALGVTEPGAIAFAVATARKYVKGTLREIHVKLNSGMYKNAFTCGIPNSTEVGNLHCAALGYVAADAGKGLECLDGVGRNDNLLARRLVRPASASRATASGLEALVLQLTVPRPPPSRRILSSASRHF